MSVIGPYDKRCYLATFTSEWVNVVNMVITHGS